MSLGFHITGNKGFHMTFANGWTISVQWGAGNYCDNYNYRIGAEPPPRGFESTCAEIAAWPTRGPSRGEMMSFGSDTVKPRVRSDEVLEWMVKIAAFPDADSAQPAVTE